MPLGLSHTSSLTGLTADQVRAFQSAGFSLLPQAYMNSNEPSSPWNCQVEVENLLGTPRHLTLTASSIGIYTPNEPPPARRYQIDEYFPHLFGTGWSVYLGEAMTARDWLVLEAKMSSFLRSRPLWLRAIFASDELDEHRRSLVEMALLSKQRAVLR